MKHLRQLEDQSVYILREAYKHFNHLAMLWSMGKDSTVLLWLARKAFFGHVPFPLLHVDTSYKIPAMIEYRDRIAREWRLNLVVGQNKEALAAGMNHTLGRDVCCTALKTTAMKNLVEEKGYTGIILGVRADEDSTRAKERYFSPRDKHGDWDFATSRRNCGISSRPRFPRARISGFIRSSTGPRSTSGNTSSMRASPSWISIWTGGMAHGIEVWAARPVPCRSNPRRRLSMRLLRSCVEVMWRASRPRAGCGAGYGDAPEEGVHVRRPMPDSRRAFERSRS
jgi:3'-phosphoadenosine 5'-phosphosulfate sulfotransferase (PAPS reductase)/FAD synthetase